MERTTTMPTPDDHPSRPARPDTPARAGRPAPPDRATDHPVRRCRHRRDAAVAATPAPSGWAADDAYDAYDASVDRLADALLADRLADALLGALMDGPDSDRSSGIGHGVGARRTDLGFQRLVVAVLQDLLAR